MRKKARFDHFRGPKKQKVAPKAAPKSPSAPPAALPGSPAATHQMILRRRALTFRAVLLALPLVLAAAEYCSRRKPSPHEQKLRDLATCYVPAKNKQYEAPEKTKFIPIVIHRILPKDDDFGGIYDPYVKEGLNGLNEAFRKLNYQFVVSEKRDIHDDFLFGYGKAPSNREFQEKLSTMAETNAVDHAINIFILPQIEDDTFGASVHPILDGLSNKPSGKSIIFISYDNNSHPGTLFPHEVGHTLNLLHTFDQTIVGNSSCAPGGDYDCTSPADPGVYDKQTNPEGCVVNEQCEIVSCGKDPNGVPYATQLQRPDNYMSYYRDCRGSWSTGQEHIMHCVAQTVKSDLLHDTPPAKVEDVIQIVRVGCGATSAKTVQEGVDEITRKGGGKVEICGGTYKEDIMISGIPSETYFSDKYTLKLTLQAAPDAQGYPQPVIIDGDHQHGFMMVLSHDIKSKAAKKPGHVEMNIRDITFANGYLSLDDNINRLALLDVSAASSANLEHVTIQDSVGKGFVALVMTPNPSATISTSTFTRNELYGGDLIKTAIGGSVTVDHCTFTENGSFLRSKKGKVFKGAFIGLSANAEEKESNPSANFQGNQYDRNNANGINFTIYPPDTTPVEQFFQKTREVSIGSAPANGICLAKDVKCTP